MLCTCRGISRSMRSARSPSAAGRSVPVRPAGMCRRSAGVARCGCGWSVWGVTGTRGRTVTRRCGATTNGPEAEGAGVAAGPDAALASGLRAHLPPPAHARCHRRRLSGAHRTVTTAATVRRTWPRSHRVWRPPQDAPVTGRLPQLLRSGRQDGPARTTSTRIRWPPVSRSCQCPSGTRRSSSWAAPRGATAVALAKAGQTPPQMPVRPPKTPFRRKFRVFS